MFNIILFVIIIDVIKALNRDVNTFSNYHEIQIHKLHIEWLLDLNQKIINGTAEYHFNVMKNNIKEIHLDIYQLDIIIVYDYNTGTVYKHEIQYMGEQSLKQGDILKIYLPKSYNNGDQIKLRIKYGVTEKARALSFMTKEQTESKVLPYLYSYCQDNNCRSMIPLQDTPSIKQYFSALVLVKDPRIKVYMTGNLLEGKPFNRMNVYTESLTEYHISLDIKIPSYLLAIVAGNLEQRKVGNQQTSRSYVITEPTSIDRVALELEFLQDYVDALSNYIGPYEWGDYKIVILPPSFPLGGMEHPLLTFASPTIIVGDKSGVGVAIHEIAHSWVGNTVTCSDWANMWINEGFCTFLERKILEQYNGADYSKMYSFLSNDTMFQQMARYGMDHSYSSLHPNTSGENPDDSQSEVPYNKGYQLLVYIEQQIGEQNFQKMLQQYIIQFKWQSIDEDIFYRYLLSWISTNLGKEHASLKEIKTIYKEWVYVPGKPPRQLDFHTDAYDKAMALAKAWLDNKGDKVPDNAEDYRNYIYYQKQQFLNEIATKYGDMTDKNYKLIDQTYQLSDQKDSRLLYRWLIGCLRGKFYDRMEVIKNFMGTHGARSWLVNMYETLFKDKPDVAREWFTEFRDFYHPSVVDALENGIFKNSIKKIEQ
ncbi:unnamed protein product [Paramecium pentaurelia]|uniref:Peptidase M1 leukotriene A4 hydrolase/aminopeptidase C-terminal domain-containing protein n=1 Tax=Paramecium pentaurelia TaxID=43138 RepID=A0A8S1YGZ4_9CILI|nr:unnamed protein product [Paramecium pentaurelia]